MNLLIATNDGLWEGTRDGATWTARRQWLAGQRVTAVIAREGVILAGTRQGICRSSDGGETWHAADNGLDIKYVRWLAYHPERSDFELAGTEPAGLFVSRDGGDQWQGAPEVTALRDRHNWFLPYSPEAGCVRGFAANGDRLYAAVEVGGLLRSNDAGQTWALAPGSDGRARFGSPPGGHIHPDVHSVAVYPDDADHVVAPTGGGLYASRDGGQTWRRLGSAGYIRAVWINPERPDHWVAGPAAGVDRRGTIEETIDAGETWRDVSAGLGTPWPRHMVERIEAVDGHLLAVLSNGRLVASPLGAWAWMALGNGLPHVNAVTAV